MFELKPITREAIPGALAKAERYRLLNEPEEAESICLDILVIEPDNQVALVMLLLALTDQFRGGRAKCFAEAQAVLPQLQRRVRAPLLRRHHLGAARDGPARPRRRRRRPRRLPLAAQGDGPLREGRGDPAARQRRRHPALEHLRRLCTGTGCGRTRKRAPSRPWTINLRIERPPHVPRHRARPPRPPGAAPAARPRAGADRRPHRALRLRRRPRCARGGAAPRGAAHRPEAHRRPVPGEGLGRRGRGRRAGR